MLKYYIIKCFRHPTRPLHHQNHYWTIWISKTAFPSAQPGLNNIYLKANIGSWLMTKSETLGFVPSSGILQQANLLDHPPVNWGSTLGRVKKFKTDRIILLLWINLYWCMNKRFPKFQKYLNFHHLHWTFLSKWAL